MRKQLLRYRFLKNRKNLIYDSNGSLRLLSSRSEEAGFLSGAFGRIDCPVEGVPIDDL
jgi:hypothetical protein